MRHQRQDITPFVGFIGLVLIVTGIPGPGGDAVGGLYSHFGGFYVACVVY